MFASCNVKTFVAQRCLYHTAHRGRLIMTKPFNIRIKYGTNEVTLTILPAEEGYYKVIYYGAILGAVCYDGEHWEDVPAEKIAAGDLPFYRSELNDGRIDVELTDYVIERIGEEIDLYVDEEYV